jgi:ankyrin repeat protein
MVGDRTLLHVAVESNEPEVCEILLRRRDSLTPRALYRSDSFGGGGAGPFGTGVGRGTFASAPADVDARDGEGRTPLMLAADAGKTRCAEVLADRGANQDAAPGLRRTVENLLNVYI